MADKEERILIIKIMSDPYTCDIGGICKDKVCLKTLCEMGITHQEAIEKIKNASDFYLSHKLGCTKEEEAEYILNALLEGVKK